MGSHCTGVVEQALKGCSNSSVLEGSLQRTGVFELVLRWTRVYWVSNFVLRGSVPRLDKAEQYAAVEALDAGCCSTTQYCRFTAPPAFQARCCHLLCKCTQPCRQARLPLCLSCDNVPSPNFCCCTAGARCQEQLISILFLHALYMQSQHLHLLLVIQHRR